MFRIRKNFTWIYYMATVLVLALPLPLEAMERKSLPRAWKMKYVTERFEADGPHTDTTRVRVVLDSEAILVDRSESRIMVIPFDAVTGADYYKVHLSRTEQVLGVESMDELVDRASGCERGTALCMAFGLPFYAILAPFEGQHHFVLITWQDPQNPEVELQAEFQLGKRDYKPFFAELERATGKKFAHPWEEIEERMRQSTAPAASADPESVATARARFDRWSREQCAVIARDNPAWLKPDSNLWTASLCEPQREREASSSELVTRQGEAQVGGRCLVLATDSPEYQESCAAGREQLAGPARRPFGEGAGRDNQSASDTRHQRQVGAVYQGRERK